MRLLITGGAGFIGSNFVHYWMQKYPSDFVCVYDKLTYAGNISNLKSLETNLNYKFIKADICDRKVFEETLDTYQIDTVVNFAAETHVDRSIINPEDFINTNIIGTYKILESIRNKPSIRLHHVSTDEVFGALPLDKPETKFSLSTAYNPKSPYSASKAGADHLVKSYTSTYGINATISNCSNNFGPYCFIEKLIPLVITRALDDKNIPVYGTGLQVRDWLYVEDHCHGIELILQKGVSGQSYLLGGNAERTNIWMVKKILEIMNKPESLITYVEDRKGHDERYAIDYSATETALGYKPQKNIEERLLETIEWYKNNRSWWDGSVQEAHKIAEQYLTKR